MAKPTGELKNNYSFMVSHSNGTVSNSRQFIYSPFLIVATYFSIRLHIWVVSSRHEYQSQPDYLDSTLISPRLSMESVHYRAVWLKGNTHTHTQKPIPITYIEAGSSKQTLLRRGLSACSRKHSMKRFHTSLFIQYFRVFMYLKFSSFSI